MIELSNKKIIQNIISKIRHDLTNPINAIIGYSELLLDILGGDDLNAFSKDVDSIISSGQTLLSATIGRVHTPGIKVHFCATQ